VDHFLHSGPHDRHYTIDRQAGVIAFGDGKRGVVPPPGINKVVLKEYRIGGGSLGNVSAASITQLRTTIPYIQKVTNMVPACGGMDSEGPEAFVPRALRLVRHRNRAVTYEDYEDLALAASPLVAQARCVPCYDLAKDPHGQRKRSGVLSLIILPRDGSETQPKPDRTLLQLIWSQLKTITPPSINVSVVPSRYVPVDVNVEVVLQSDAVPAVVEQNIQEEVRRFLHPVTGGPGGRGWKIGEYPRRSAFHSRIKNVSGVHHIRRVSISDDSSALARSGFFHVCSGVHQIQSVPISAADA
jgi:predicted phage baseplate assembly protein